MFGQRPRNQKTERDLAIANSPARVVLGGRSLVFCQLNDSLS